MIITSSATPTWIQHAANFYTIVGRRRYIQLDTCRTRIFDGCACLLANPVLAFFFFLAGACSSWVRARSTYPKIH